MVPRAPPLRREKINRHADNDRRPAKGRTPSRRMKAPEKTGKTGRRKNLALFTTAGSR